MVIVMIIVDINLGASFEISEFGKKFNFAYRRLSEKISRSAR